MRSRGPSRREPWQDDHAGNLHQSSRRRESERVSELGRWAESARLANRASQQIVEIGASVEAGVAHVAIDAAVDDATTADIWPTSPPTRFGMWPCGSRTGSAAAIPGSASSSAAPAARRSRGRAYGQGRTRVEDRRRRSARRTPPPATRGACGRRPPSSRRRTWPSRLAATSATISWHSGQPKCRRKTSSRVRAPRARRACRRRRCASRGPDQ